MKGLQAGRRWLGDWYRRHLAAPTIGSLAEVDCAPVFVIGANRSGTSAITSLLAQHPDLEGLFEGDLAPQTERDQHFQGYCESSHLWACLLRDDWSQRGDEGPLWSHPRYVSRLYRDAPFGPREALYLAGQVQRHRRTPRDPLIKDQLNILRIGLIRALFPRARFVLVIRDYQDFIRSGSHKWYGGQKPSVAVGLHWLTVNQIAAYDLERHAASDYTIFHYETLFRGKDALAEELQRLAAAIRLAPFAFDLSGIDAKYRFLDEEAEPSAVGFDLAKRIAQYERQSAGGD